MVKLDEKFGDKEMTKKIPKLEFLKKNYDILPIKRKLRCRCFITRDQAYTSKYTS